MLSFPSEHEVLPSIGQQVCVFVLTEENVCVYVYRYIYIYICVCVCVCVCVVNVRGPEHLCHS